MEEMGTADEMQVIRSDSHAPAVKSLKRLGIKQEAAKKTEEIEINPRIRNYADIGMGAAALAVLGLISV